VITFLDGSQQAVEAKVCACAITRRSRRTRPAPATPTSRPATAEVPIPTITPPPCQRAPPRLLRCRPTGRAGPGGCLAQRGKGALAVAGLFALAGLYQAVRSLDAQNDISQIIADGQRDTKQLPDRRPGQPGNTIPADPGITSFHGGRPAGCPPGGGFFTTGIQGAGDQSEYQSRRLVLVKRIPNESLRATCQLTARFTR